MHVNQSKLGRNVSTNSFAPFRFSFFQCSHTASFRTFNFSVLLLCWLGVREEVVVPVHLAVFTVNSMWVPSLSTARNSRQSPRPIWLRDFCRNDSRLKEYKKQLKYFPANVRTCFPTFVCSDIVCWFDNLKDPNFVSKLCHWNLDEYFRNCNFWKRSWCILI